MKNITAVILAAGEGKRMKSNKMKIVHKVCGKAMVDWVYTSAREAGVEEIFLVVGHKAEQVRECMGEQVTYVMQEKQLGTGHAVMQAEEQLRGREGYTLVLYGDTPMITSETLKKCIRFHMEQANAATVITAELDNPTGYGRIIKDAKGTVCGIVEEKDATGVQKAIREVNSGMYCFNTPDLLAALQKINNHNAQGEYYLTDTLEVLIRENKKVAAYKTADSREIMGVNDRVQLTEAGKILRERILKNHMLSGVTIIDPSSTYIDTEAVIGMDTVIYPGTILEGSCEIGGNCIIGPNTRIVDSHIADGVQIVNSVILESTVGRETKIGPFAYLRPNSRIGEKVKIGDFVEVKNSSIGDETSVSHLTYIGDSEFGKKVNVGCGVVTVNYNGREKNKTVVGDYAFVGCNVNLVAPVEVKENSYIAAGSTITEEVPADALAIARSRQVVKEGWVTRKGVSRKK